VSQNCEPRCHQDGSILRAKEIWFQKEIALASFPSFYVTKGKKSTRELSENQNNLVLMKDEIICLVTSMNGTRMGNVNVTKLMW
jgi:hypothetical protein